MAEISQTTFSDAFSLNENVAILNTIQLEFIPNGPTGDNTALVHIMAWHRTGNKPSSEPVIA